MRQSFIDYMQRDTFDSTTLRAQSFYNENGDEILGDLYYFFKHTPEGIEVLECSIKFKNSAFELLEKGFRISALYDDVKAIIADTERKTVTFSCNIVTY